MGKLKIKKGFSLLELLISATLFSAAMIGIIATVTTSISTINKSQNIKKLNGAARDFNQFLSKEIKSAKCLDVPADNSQKLEIKDEECINTKKTILIDKNGQLVIEAGNQKMENILSNKIRVSQIEKNKKIFEVDENSLVSIKIKFILSNNDDKESLIYETSIARRRW